MLWRNCFGLGDVSGSAKQAKPYLRAKAGIAYPGVLLKTTSIISNPAKMKAGQDCLPRTQKREAMCIQSSLQKRMSRIESSVGVEGTSRGRIPGAVFSRVRGTTMKAEESPGFLK